MEITYASRTATADQIFRHLNQCKENFIPSLDTRVDITAYAQKLYDKSVTFEAWSGDLLAGLIATYFKPENNTGFITNVSILRDFMGQGIAGKLLAACVSFSRDNGIEVLKLEVNRKNSVAIALYKKFNFTESGTQDDLLVMELDLAR